MRSRLIMPKTNKQNKKSEKNLFTNYIFLKIVVSNIRDAFGANYLTTN